MHLGFTTVSLYSQNADVGLYASIARRADSLGFESMWAGHHIALPTAVAPDYPYTATGVGPHTARMHRLDLWVLFGHLAAHTTKLRFGSGIYLLPLVNPLVTARAVATADVLSNGRIIFGIGVGWNREEYAILGEDPIRRHRRRAQSADPLDARGTRGTGRDACVVRRRVVTADQRSRTSTAHRGRPARQPRRRVRRVARVAQPLTRASSLRTSSRRPSAASSCSISSSDRSASRRSRSRL